MWMINNNEIICEKKVIWNRFYYSSSNTQKYEFGGTKAWITNEM